MKRTLQIELDPLDDSSGTVHVLNVEVDFHRAGVSFNREIQPDPACWEVLRCTEALSGHRVDYESLPPAQLDQFKAVLNEELIAIEESEPDDYDRHRW